MEQLFNYIYYNKGFRVGHYWLVFGDTVVVDSEWYESCWSRQNMWGIDRYIHDATGCRYLEFEWDREMTYEWKDGGYRG